MQIENRVLLTVENQIALVRLNRPDKHNALDLDLFRAIAEMQKKLARERSVRAVVLSGSGVDFCTGLDVKSMIRDRMGMVKLLWKGLPWRANLAQLLVGDQVVEKDDAVQVIDLVLDRLRQ